MDAVALEVLRHALDGAAEEMGVALLRSAFSPNIKERLDCSAAVFAPDGEAVAQAAHIPVHLGSMPASVAAARATLGTRMAPGTVVVVNDPWAGGTHLPDLTVVSVVASAEGEVLGLVANRAHHADVGGAAPGSMPADARDVAAEGLRLPPLVLADADGVRKDVVELIVANSRTPDERRGDLRAQLAANHVGGMRLRALTARMGADAFAGGIVAVRDHAERRVRAALAALDDGVAEAADVLEVGDGARLHARVTIAGDELEVDLTGCDDQVDVNLNAVAAVARSAALYVLRLVVDPGAPANAGGERPLRVVTRPGSIVDASWPSPVAAGNVETSQRIVDVILRALASLLPERVPAASQGTMNNLLLGASAPTPFSYYETIGGGEGATPWRDGMSGVHTHMTNTRSTPAEAVELAYPLRVRRAELRPGTGGAGRFSGGDGAVREVEVLADCVLTLQGERRERGPWGLAGGADGAPGRDTLVHPDGTEEALPAKGTRAVAAGSRVRVETPGGGGWGLAP